MKHTRWMLLAAALSLPACDRAPTYPGLEPQVIVPQPRSEYPVTLHGTLKIAGDVIQLAQGADRVRLENVGLPVAEELEEHDVAVTGRWHYQAFYVSEMHDESALVPPDSLVVHHSW